jgi:hypothetical protein
VSKAARIEALAGAVVTLIVLGSCSGSSGSSETSSDPNVNAQDIPATADEFVVLAWNDLGMHCLNPTYDEAVLLPPYNTVWAQVIRRGSPPAIVTEGLTAEYRILNNTTSYDKTDDGGAVFAGFWDYAVTLFGTPLAHDTGLNLENPALHNGLSGTMVVRGNHFQVNGIPVTPVDDDGVWNPYQVMEVTIREGDAIVAQTRATVPTSDEIHCANCHAEGGDATGNIGGGGPSAFNNILLVHDALHGSNYSPPLADRKPVLCASCHGSPALGTSGPGSAGKFLSQAVHGAHAAHDEVPACYECHPGPVTKCSRSLAHATEDGNCTTCHGSLADVAQSIADGRVPWVTEPKCATCHTGVPGVDTGTILYRNAAGHGGVSCAACHNSPHAMHPSREPADRYQPLQYQNSAKTIGSCGTCHENSRGLGGDDFAETHAGAGGRATACGVCHTVVSADTAAWPHAYQWKAR